MHESALRIDSVRLLISGKEVVLNPEEAVRLRQALDGLPSAYPVYVDPNDEPFPERWTITRSGMLGQTNVLTIHV